MKIECVSVENVTSYNSRTVFPLQKDMNILIGPNGSGKSNIQRIISIILTTYFIYQYQFQINENESKMEVTKFLERRQLEKTLDKYIGNAGAQEIELDLVPEEVDIENMLSIQGHLAKLIESLDIYEKVFAKTLSDYLSEEQIQSIKVGEPIKYKISNLNLLEPEKDSPEGVFLKYLRTFFIYSRFASRIDGMTLSSPVFFFFSQRTFQGNVTVKSNQIEDQNYHSGFQTAYRAAVGDDTNLLQWGIQHYTRAYYKCVLAASKSKKSTADELFAENPDVVLLDRYLKKLGYQWRILHSQDGVTFQFALAKDGQQITTEKFSSGEREIVHFLIAMFALNVKSGVIIIDEPELHLHPRWQRIFLSLFEDASAERDNQFIIATHSPVFVNSNTVSKVIRVFRRKDGSDLIHLSDATLPKDRNLVRMINSQNNEGMFFADSVLLVEGATDKIIFGSIVNELYRFLPASLAVEVLEVGGKHNFKDYINLLHSLHTPSPVIADFDYIYEVGDPELKRFYVADSKKQWDALKDKGTLDGASLIERLDKAIQEGEVNELKKFWQYFRARRIRIRDDLDDVANQRIDAEVARCANEGIYLLRLGAIESYLPPGAKAVSRSVELVSHEKWYLEKADPKLAKQLFELTGQALGISKEDIASLFNVS